MILDKRGALQVFHVKHLVWSYVAKEGTDMLIYFAWTVRTRSEKKQMICVMSVFVPHYASVVIHVLCSVT